VGAVIVGAKPAVVATDAVLVTDAILFALRSILPLNAFLILLIVFVLRVPLPSVTFAVPIPSDLLPDDDDDPAHCTPSADTCSKRVSSAGEKHGDHDGDCTDDEGGEVCEDEKARRKRLRQERTAKMARAVDLAAHMAEQVLAERLAGAKSDTLVDRAIPLIAEKLS
jgi:hypothetical protein